MARGGIRFPRREPFKAAARRKRVAARGRAGRPRPSCVAMDVGADEFEQSLPLLQELVLGADFVGKAPGFRASSPQPPGRREGVARAGHGGEVRPGRVVARLQGAQTGPLRRTGGFLLGPGGWDVRQQLQPWPQCGPGGTGWPGLSLLWLPLFSLLDLTWPLEHQEGEPELLPPAAFTAPRALRWPAPGDSCPSCLPCRSRHRVHRPSF